MLENAKKKRWKVRPVGMGGDSWLGGGGGGAHGVARQAVCAGVSKVPERASGWRACVLATRP